MIRTKSGEDAESIAEPRVSDPKPVASYHCGLFSIVCIGVSRLSHLSVSIVIDRASEQRLQAESARLHADAAENGTLAERAPSRATNAGRAGVVHYLNSSVARGTGRGSTVNRNPTGSRESSRIVEIRGERLAEGVRSDQTFW